MASAFFFYKAWTMDKSIRKYAASVNVRLECTKCRVNKSDLLCKKCGILEFCANCQSAQKLSCTKCKRNSNFQKIIIS